MAAISLRIDAPAHHEAFEGNEAVTLRGAFVTPPPDLGGATLFFRWYSSLFSGGETAVEQEKFAINNVEGVEITDPEFAYTPTPPLGIGTHVISFAATDQPGETTAEQEAVQHGGVTGGAEGDGRCIIHVFRANLISPPNNAVLSRAGSTLEAEAPATWGVETDTPGVFTPNDEYHKHNRLRYRWQFTPAGAPANRQPLAFIPEVDELIFDPPQTATERPIVRYQGPLPATLTGGYNLSLHVEDAEEELGGHSTAVTNIQVGP
jgi:hypothetical protein